MSLDYRLPFPAAPPSSSALRLFLLLHVLLHGGVSATCPSSCANLAGISYPFGAARSCGAPGFVLDCFGPVALWTLPLQPETFRFPVLDITNNFTHGSIILNLPASQPNIQNPSCTLNSTDTLDDNNPSSYAFAGANLFLSNRLAVLNFSSQDVYLFFGCEPANAHANSLVETESSYCTDYRNNCAQTPPTPCVQLITPTQELNLSHLAQDLSCTHYKSFLAVTPQQWNYSSIQLSWSNLVYYSDCTACQESGGTCGYDMQPNDNFSFRCSVPSSPKGCIGNLCTTGAKVAALGVPSAALVIALITVFLVRFVRRKKRGLLGDGVPSRSSHSSTSRRSGGVPSRSSHSSTSLRSKSFSSRYGPVSAKEFTFKELAQATESFSEHRMVGDGGFGAVYEGRLRDGRKVAVKRLYHDNFRRMDKFFNEIRILTSLQHSNLVKLYGYCCEDERDLLLVFEYVSNGTLADHLHNRAGQGLLWNIRLNIACETAEALTYLHNSLNPPIFHRDVKSTNILLDEHFHVKLADFGLSRLVPPEASHISTAPQGTPGYLDPDYHQCYQLTDKSDVYSFGVVLIEIISAMLAVDMTRDRREINLSSLALTKIASGAWHELVDARLRIDLYPEVQSMVLKVVEIAFRCLAADKDDRPKMSDVAEELAKIKESGYGLASAEMKINVSCSTHADETIGLIKSSCVHSPNSVESPWPSSNTSSNLSSF